VLTPSGGYQLIYFDPEYIELAAISVLQLADIQIEA
jgi:hypothetical protein